MLNHRGEDVLHVLTSANLDINYRFYYEVAQRNSEESLEALAVFLHFTVQCMSQSSFSGESLLLVFSLTQLLVAIGDILLSLVLSSDGGHRGSIDPTKQLINLSGGEVSLLPKPTNGEWACLFFAHIWQGPDFGPRPWSLIYSVLYFHQ